jgi:hypothetical protein
MGTVAIIVIGLVALTLVAVVGDGIVKVGVARAAAAAAVRQKAPAEELESVQRRVALLESRLDEREESLRKLQEELRFVSRMLEDRSGRPSP